MWMRSLAELAALPGSTATAQQPARIRELIPTASATDSLPAVERQKPESLKLDLDALGLWKVKLQKRESPTQSRVRPDFAAARSHSRHANSRPQTPARALVRARVQGRVQLPKCSFADVHIPEPAQQSTMRDARTLFPAPMPPVPPQAAPPRYPPPTISVARQPAPATPARSLAAFAHSA
jgi:hypothetical protein